MIVTNNNHYKSANNAPTHTSSIFARVMPSLRLDKLLPWLVLAAGLAATFFLQQAAFNAARRIQRDNFDYQSREIMLRIEQRLAAYEQVMRGVKGLYAASKSVERDEFHDYVASLHLADRFPGIQGIGYSQIILPQEKARHIGAIRKEGFPTYTVRPEGERDLYTSIVYIEPFSDRNLRAFGYDMYSEAVRRAAMEQARDLNEPVMSGKVTLVQEIAGQQVQTGFLMYLPVYRNGSPHVTLADRRANILGWVYAPFRTNDLMTGILGEQASKIDIDIYDGSNATPEALMYDSVSGQDQSGAPLYHFTRRIEAINHNWAVRLHSLPIFEANLDTGRATTIRLTGILGSVLLSLLVWQLVSGRTRALKLAQEMTRELHESERHFRAVTESANDAIITSTGAGNIVGWNAAAERLFGYTKAEIIGQPITVLMPERFRNLHSEGLARVVTGGTPHLIGKTVEVFGLRKDGREFPLELSLAQWQAADSQFFTAIIRDITGRKEADAELRVAATVFESQEGMAITDAHNVILRVNRAFTEITGYTAEEAVDKTPSLLKSGRHDAAFYAAMWESILRTGAWHGEIWNRRKNGEVYPEQLTITAVKNSTGEITHHVATMHDITERKQAEEQIRTLAFYDTLTNLPNRRLLNDRLGQTMAASKRSGHYGALMFLDLDNFKPLNDTYGHDVGDLLLIEVARRLAGCVREVDTVARFGGDEFVVMLSELDADKAESTAQAGIIAEKIRAILAESYALKFQQEGNAETTIEHRCTSSIGVVLFINHEGSPEDVLKWADMAMYQAKEGGRNRVHFYEALR